MKRIFLIIFLLLPVLSNAQTAPKYLLDGSNVVWFLHISDTHVDSDARKYYKDYFPWVLKEAVPVINPSFVVNSGDLTDSTSSTFPYYGSGPHEDEWLKYRDIYMNALMTPSFYYDVPGNHDAYGDKDLAYYLEYSLQGSFTKSTQQSWYLDNGKGIYHFFSVATTANDGKQWPYDNQEFTDDELIQIDRFLKGNPAASMRIVFGHHDYEKENAKNKDRFLVLLKDYGVSYYGHGHEHDRGFRIGDGKIIKYRVASLGQSEGDNVAIWAIDNFGVTIKTFQAMSMFPLVVVTTPADVILDDAKNRLENPYIPPVPRSCTNAPVRALVFSRSQNPEVSFRIDSGPDLKMARRKNNPYQYRGYFDATKLSIGLHSVTVTVITDSYGETTNEFYVSDIPCEIGEEDQEEIIDVDAGFEVYTDLGEDIIPSDISYNDMYEQDSSELKDTIEMDSDEYEDEPTDIFYDSKTDGPPTSTDIGIINDLVIFRPDNSYMAESLDSGCSCSSLQ